MKLKTLSFAFLFAASGIAFLPQAFAGDTIIDAIDSLVGRRGEDAILHTEAAIHYTKEAIKVGKAGDASQLVTHAQTALENMHAANRDNDDNPHANEGIKHLRAAVAEGKKRHISAATRHAEEALIHLEASIHS
jgi:phosphotransferase system HPr-like phosphotransfer protein